MENKCAEYSIYMQVRVSLSNIVTTLTKPLKRNRRPKPNQHRRFYKQGFMANEIEALQSIFRGEDTHHTPK
jgi:hypothetical protein